jgi:tripartite ATP-independent transporter DctP family solute receptor
MKRVGLLLIIFCFVSAFLFAGGAQEPSKATAEVQKKYSWRIGHSGAEGSVRDIFVQKFKEVVEQKTSGRVTIELFPGEVLGTAQEMVEMVKLGALDFKVAGAGSLTNIIPECTATHAAFILNDYEEGHAMLEGPVGDKLKALCEENGFKGLSFFDLGFAQITNNVRPIYRASDMAGLKIRSPNQPQSIATFQALDCAVSTMAFSEVYLGLSQGVVDGQFNPVSAIKEMKFYEVQKHLAIVNLFYYHGIFIMNLDLWNSLDPELQGIVQDAAMQGQEASYNFMESTDDQYLKDFEKNNVMKITYPDLDSFREKIQPVYRKYEEMAGKEMMDLVFDFLTEYRKTK